MSEVFCASVGSQLHIYDLDGGGARLSYSISLDDAVQYGCVNAATKTVYFATSDGGPYNSGSRNLLHALALPARGKPYAPICDAVVLPSRAIHVSLDAKREHVIVTFNKPAAFEVYGLDARGCPSTRTHTRKDLGVGPHQGLVSPDNEVLIISERGNDAIGTGAPISGAMRVYDYSDGAATHRQTVTSPWADGFEPRNVLFHPTMDLVYLVLESQNRFLTYKMRDKHVVPEPMQMLELLASPSDAKAGQIAGAIKMNHAGTKIYVANRAHGHVVKDGMRVFTGGENSIAYLSVQPDTGLTEIGGRIPVGGIGPRNISISADDKWLVASSWMAHLVPTDRGELDRVEAGFDIFQLNAEGVPRHAQWVPVETDATTLFWSGFLPA